MPCGRTGNGGILCSKDVTMEPFVKLTYRVILPKAGIQNSFETLDSGSRFALNTMRCRASLARNDDFLLI